MIQETGSLGAFDGDTRVEVAGTYNRIDDDSWSLCIS
jgi:hypothetical protein